MKWRALTLVQPMASAIIEPSSNPKRIENRTRPFPTGWVGLHAGKKYDEDYALTIQRILGPECNGWVDEGRCAQGAMLGAVLVDWAVEYPPPSKFAYKLLGERGVEAQLVNGSWAFGPWCHHIAEVRPLPVPIPCRGMLGLWTVTPGVAAALDGLVPEAA